MARAYPQSWNCELPRWSQPESDNKRNWIEKMKTNYLRAGILAMAAGGLSLVSGCFVQPNGQVTLGLPVVTIAPAVVVAPVMVPDSYTWDGVEYVGLVGDQYYYLGAGNVWLLAGPDRLAFFHGWERDHGDWRNHATRNDRFRQDSHGRNQPRREEKR
jgi:hypothetical protein